jgi:hypothetical protein
MAGLTAYQKFLQVALKYGFSLFGTPKSGALISITNYDDGYYKKGYPKTGPAFTDNGDGTATDNATGLTYIKDLTPIPDMSWTDSIAYAKNLSYAGKTDWRVANIQEVMSFLRPASGPSYYDTSIFTLNMVLWTSSPFGEYDTYVMVIMILDQILITPATIEDESLFKPLLVRGG